MPKSLASNVLQGAAIMVALRMSERLLGLVSISITARILTPDDFGVIGTASLALGFFTIFTSAGFNEVLIRQATLDRSMVHTAWTLQLILKSAVGLIVLMLAAPAAELLKEPRVEEVLQTIWIIPVLYGLSSPASPMFVRKFNFKREYVFRVSNKLITVIATITAAIIVENYWGPVYAQVIGAAAVIITSQIAFPYMPRPTFKHAKEITHFTLWTFVRSVASFAERATDEFFVRRVSTTADFALYHTSRDLSRTFVTELVTPAATPLLSGLSRLQNDPKRFLAAATSAFSAAFLIATPIAIGVSLVAEELILLVLGGQWQGAAVFLQILSFGFLAQTTGGLARTVYTAMGKQKFAAYAQIVRACFLILACGLAATYGDATDIAIWFAVTSLIATFVQYAFIYIFLKAPYPVAKLYRGPLLSALSMVLAVSYLPFPDTTPLVLVLLGKALVGASAYTASVLVIWRLLGKPDGGEKAILNRLPQSIAKRIVG